MMPVLISGFHRSGTSAVARQLHAAGLDLGDNLLGAEAANPYGHFEDLDLIEIHDAALATQGLTWKSLAPLDRTSAAGIEFRKRVEANVATFVATRPSAGRPWGIKDPRLCLFLPEWFSVVPNAKLVFVIRRPGDVVQSLHRRHSRRYVDTRQADASDTMFWTVPDLGLRLWIHYHSQVLSALPAASNVHVVDFGDRSEIEALPAALAKRWKLPLAAPLLTLDSTLGASNATQIEVRDTGLIDEAAHLWQQLNEMRVTKPIPID